MTKPKKSISDEINLSPLYPNIYFPANENSLREDLQKAIDEQLNAKLPQKKT